MVLTRVQILVIDDDEAIRDAFNEIFEADYNVITVDSGLKAIDMIAAQTFDLVFLDILMPELNGIETLKKIRAQNKKLDIVMISAIDRAQEACDSIKFGAFDYITKPFDHQVILNLVEEILLKNIHTNGIQNSIKRLKKFTNLTPREYEILELLARGLSNSEIGEQLFIHYKTVRNHITNIFSKQSINSRSKAIVLARDAGFGFKN